MSRRIVIGLLAAALLSAVHPAAAQPPERIVFSSNREGTHDIWSANADGSDARKLTTHRLDDLQPDVSPDGRTMVFVRATGMTCCGPAMDLYIANADGSDERPLAADPVLDEYRPEWSPDGETILFSRGTQAEANLYVIRPDRSGLLALTHDRVEASSPATVLSNYGSWSTDGSRVAFTSNRDGKQRLWTVVADGESEPVALTEPPVGTADTALKWSRAGDRIAFRSTRDGAAAEIYTVRPDGTDLRRLTNNAVEDRFPAWSPNGRTIVFSAVRDVTCPAQGGVLCPAQLWTMSADGSDQKRITDPPFHDSFPAFLSARAAAGAS